MRNPRYDMLVAVALALALMLTGCSTAKKASGSMEVYMQGDPTVVVAAAESALEELEMGDVTASATRVDGKLTATTARDKKVSIDVKSAGDNVSKFTVKVGKMGDKKIGQTIIDTTRSKLPG